MKEFRRKMLIELSRNLQHCTLSSALEQMWDKNLLDKTALERHYICSEVARRVQAGEAKVKAIRQLSTELNCSYEKIRDAVYRKY